MSLLCDRSMPAAARCDADGNVRVVAHPYRYEDLVEAAWRHIRETSKDQWQVRRHLRQRIQFVSDKARDPGLRMALRTELSRLG
jgi:uncharacterized membrane protein